jgi:hypothetical protein
LSATEPELFEKEVAGCLERFRGLSENERRQLVEYPPFMSWLKLSLACGTTETLKHRLPDLGRVMNTFAQPARNPTLVVSGSPVELASFDVDPLIIEAALPEYRFPPRRRQSEFREKVAYPASFFREMAALALDRIGKAWPEALREFPKYVKLIVDMIDSDYTSYSGYLHVGVVFVSTDNSPLAGLEEYLIHEFGHQILYNVSELDNLVDCDPARTYRLPWSGRETDLYGYFHAFYIYTFLAHYLNRVECRSKREQKRVSDRAAHVVWGLKRAVIELDQLDRFTPLGRGLFGNLEKSIRDLAGREVAGE